MAKPTAKTLPPPPEPGFVAGLDYAFWPLAMMLLVLRLALAARCDLVPDEAFYWTWTRHLSMGYLDHPGMVAWIMWLTTRVLGNTVLGVRAGAAVLSVASLAVLRQIAHRYLTSSRAVGYVLLMWICGPLLSVIGTIHTPDASATFFSTCALACAVRIAAIFDEGSDAPRHSGLLRWWALFGLFCGLSLLSKYTTVLVPAGVVLGLLVRPGGLKVLRNGGLYLSALIALVVFSPVIVWNARHHWISFAFQLHHGTGTGTAEGLHGAARLLSFGEFLGGQFIVWTPVLFSLAIVVIFILLRQWKRLSNVSSVLLFCGVLPLIFFGLASFNSHGEINWPAFAYVPISLLTARYLAEKWDGWRVRWAMFGCELALALNIGVHLIAMRSVQTWIERRHIHLTHQVTDLWGWQAFGQQLYLRARGLPVICNRHQDAGEAAFYMPGQPDVWCEGVGSRKTAFDYFDTGRPDYPSLPQVIYVGNHDELFRKAFAYPQVRGVFKIIMPGPGRERTIHDLER